MIQKKIKIIDETDLKKEQTIKVTSKAYLVLIIDRKCLKNKRFTLFHVI